MASDNRPTSTEEEQGICVAFFLPRWAKEGSYSLEFLAMLRLPEQITSQVTRAVKSPFSRHRNSCAIPRGRRQGDCCLVPISKSCATRSHWIRWTKHKTTRLLCVTGEAKIIISSWFQSLSTPVEWCASAFDWMAIVLCYHPHQLMGRAM